MQLWYGYIYSLFCAFHQLIWLLWSSMSSCVYYGVELGTVTWSENKQEAPRLNWRAEVFYLANIHVSIFFLAWMLLDRSCTLQLTLSPLFPPCIISDLWPGECALEFVTLRLAALSGPFFSMTLWFEDTLHFSISSWLAFCSHPESVFTSF